MERQPWTNEELGWILRRVPRLTVELANEKHDELRRFLIGDQLHRDAETRINHARDHDRARH